MMARCGGSRRTSELDRPAARGAGDDEDQRRAQTGWCSSPRTRRSNSASRRSSTRSCSSPVRERRRAPAAKPVSRNRSALTYPGRASASLRCSSVDARYSPCSRLAIRRRAGILVTALRFRYASRMPRTRRLSPPRPSPRTCSRTGRSWTAASICPTRTGAASSTAAGAHPGAVYASLNDDLPAPRTGTNGRHPLPSIDALAATLGRLGIANGTQVVVYDQDSGLYASRLWWLLRYARPRRRGAARRRVGQWIAEGRPVRSGDEARAARRVHGRRSRAADARGASTRSARRDATGARCSSTRAGRSASRDARRPIDKVAGHIPGRAQPLLQVEPRRRRHDAAAEQLRARVRPRCSAAAAAGEAVMYCGSGVTACHNLLAMEHAGLPGSPLYRVLVRVVERSVAAGRNRTGARRASS